MNKRTVGKTIHAFCSLCKIIYLYCTSTKSEHGKLIAFLKLYDLYIRTDPTKPFIVHKLELSHSPSFTSFHLLQIFSKVSYFQHFLKFCCYIYESSDFAKHSILTVNMSLNLSLVIFDVHTAHASPIFILAKIIEDYKDIISIIL